MLERLRRIPLMMFHGPVHSRPREKVEDAVVYQGEHRLNQDNKRRGARLLGPHFNFYDTRKPSLGPHVPASVPLSGARASFRSR